MGGYGTNGCRKKLLHFLEVKFDLIGDKVLKLPNLGGSITVKREHSDDRIKECVEKKRELDRQPVCADQLAPTWPLRKKCDIHHLLLL